LKVTGRWRYVCREVDQHGQVIDVSVSARRYIRAARRLFATALDAHGEPTAVVTDRAPTLLAVVDELMPGVFHNTEQYANNRIEADQGELKSGFGRSATEPSFLPRARLAFMPGPIVETRRRRPVASAKHPLWPNGPGRSRPSGLRRQGLVGDARWVDGDGGVLARRGATLVWHAQIVTVGKAPSDRGRFAAAS
jgi:DDE domain